MRKNYFIVALMTLVSSFVLKASVRELHVSPDGLSPHEALKQIRQAKRAGDKSAFVVKVASGMYCFDEPLVMTQEDSGSSDAPVRWIGEDGAVFSGGTVIKGWRDDGDGVWSAPVPASAGGKLFESLYIDGRRADRACLPESGDYHFKTWRQRDEVVSGVTNYVQEFTVKEASPELLKKLEQLSKEELAAVQCRVFVKWSYASYPVDSVLNGVISVSGKAAIVHWKKWNEAKKNYVRFENVEAGFTKRGQWFYDVKSKRVKYRPLDGEDMNKVQAVAPLQKLVSLVKIKGDISKWEFVHDISFENISFSATITDGDMQPNGAVKQYQLQAAYKAGAAVCAEGAQRVTFNGCKVFNTENYGFEVGEGCVSNAIVSCEIRDAGAGGIWLGSHTPNILKDANPVWREIRDPVAHPFKTEMIYDTSSSAVRFNVIDNNLITNCGRFNPEGCGIVLTHAADTKVTHNEISDLYYTAISVGWTWGYYGSYAQRNEISFNRISNIGQGKMADMGGVYTLASSFGTVVTNNVIMDIKSSSYGGWGMYNDEGSEGILWENNLVANTSSDSYHIHFGRNNKVVNCIMINGNSSRVCVSRVENHHQVSFERNIIYWSKGPLFDPITKRNALKDGRARAKWVNNIFWCASGVTELNGVNPSIVLDPGFVDAAKGDWRLKPDSQALKFGFKPWDYSLSGRRK